MHAVQCRLLQRCCRFSSVHGMLSEYVLNGNRRELVGNVQELLRRHVLVGCGRICQLVPAVQRRNLLCVRLVF